MESVSLSSWNQELNNEWKKLGKLRKSYKTTSRPWMKLIFACFFLPFIVFLLNTMRKGTIYEVFLSAIYLCLAYAIYCYSIEYRRFVLYIFEEGAVASSVNNNITAIYKSGQLHATAKRDIIGSWIGLGPTQGTVYINNKSVGYYDNSVEVRDILNECIMKETINNNKPPK